MNPFSLDNKTILVTGASSGIGRGIAIECSKAGATVVLSGRNEERLFQVMNSLFGSGHLTTTADLSSQEGIDMLVDQLPDLSGCVFSAAIPDVSPIKYYKRNNVESLFKVNILSYMMLLSALLKKKKIKKGASIVFISAISGVFVGTIGDSAYCATKGAVNGFVKSAALELSASGIRVNSINPGLVPTEILRKSNAIFSEEHHTAVALEKYPLKRLGTPEDIAYGAIYLLSDASSWVTGINLVIDGGYVLS